jgi:6-pyruvoyl-tetrahydropterin synthase
MYSLAVRRHVMIAHSFAGAVFGPAQRLHGATYTVEAEFRRGALDADGLVCDIGLADAALEAVLQPIEYRNLDELEEFRGRNTTTEYLAGWVFAQLAAKLGQGALGPGTAEAIQSMRITLHESPSAWAAFEDRL